MPKARGKSGKAKKIGEKGLKRKAEDDGDKILDVPSDEEENLDREPTEEELRESKKPKNQLNVETVRGKKRKFTEKVVENSRDKLQSLAKETAHEYLIRWKNDKKQWKFEKLKQKFIQNNALCVESFNEEMWPIALEYLKNGKGACKKFLIDTAQKVIQEADHAIMEDSKKTHLLQETRYLRARELLQMLN